MSAQSGWVVIYRAKNGWNFRSKIFPTQLDATRQARTQMERGVFADVKVVGPSGEAMELPGSTKAASAPAVVV